MLVAAYDPDKEKNIKGFSDDRLIEQSEESRNNILALEEEMGGMESTLDEQSLVHHFAPGVYGREIFMPQGHVVIGKIHKHAHLNVILKGTVMVTTEGGTEEICAPHVFTSLAGTKRAVYMLEDTRWMTIHPTEETDLEKIEEEVIAPTYEAFQKFAGIASVEKPAVESADEVN